MTQDADSRPTAEQARASVFGRRNADKAIADRELRSETLWSIALRHLRHNPGAMIGLSGLLVLILISIVAPLIAPYDAIAIDGSHPLEGPSSLHWFGTDNLGRDILSRVLLGGRESLRVALLAVLISVGGGTVVGLISGYVGGGTDMVVQRLVDIWLAFPEMLLLLVIISTLGPSLTTLLVAVGFAGIPAYSRLVRGTVLGVSSGEFITAARLVGAPGRRIMWRHLLPNILAPIIVFSTLRLGGVILSTAGLSYIGLGAQPPSPEWGAMLNFGRYYLGEAWWMSIFPGLGIFIAVLSVNLLGDGVRDALDPKMRQR